VKLIDGFADQTIDLPNGQFSIGAMSRLASSEKSKSS
jgi:hypothetical protein